MRSKKAAMEMSIGTIVVIVLAMSMLILGLMLIRNIFSSGQNVLKMTDQQLMNELRSMYGTQKELSVFPGSQEITVQQGEPMAFGIGITNLGAPREATFSYEVKAVESDLVIGNKCGTGYIAQDLEKLISIGQTEGSISIASGQTYITRVVFDTKVGDPICLVRFRVNAEVGGQPYGSPQIMDVNFKAGK